MKGMKKRILSLLLAGGMILTSLALPGQTASVAEAAGITEGLAAKYEFEDGFKDSVNTDVTGEIVGDTAQPQIIDDSVRGKVMDATGNSTATVRTENPLYKASNLQGVTVSAWINADAVNAWKGVWSFSQGSDREAGYFGMASNGRLYYNRSVANEDYVDMNGFDGTITDNGGWEFITVAMDQSKISMYKNGTLAEEATPTTSGGHTVSDMLAFITETPYIYFGSAAPYHDIHNNWGSGDFQMDNFKVFSRALSADEIKTDYQADAVESDAARLSVPTETIRDLTLPVTGASGLSTISWASSDENVIGVDGTVTRPTSEKGDANITLTATVSYGDQKTERQFIVTVEADDGQPVNTVLAKYDFESGNIDGSTIKDTSGNGRDAAIKGTGASTADGVLTLPGGASSSGAAYVELPTGMFDDQDTLTISVWLKNETGAGNYAAMFFGTTESLPTGYWLLNPCNPSGTFKSVITNSYSSNAPYNTEYGFSPTVSSNGIAGPKTGSEWAMYTTIIRPGSITAYYNGEKLGTVVTNRTVSEFGDDLVAYLGKSSYSDPFYKGGIDNVLIDSAAYTDAQVTELYYTELGDEEAVKRALEEDAQWLVLADSEVISDMDLPETGKNGSVITWESDAADYLDKNGKVNRPTAQEGNKQVNLTATLSLAGQEIQKSFSITVLADTPENDLKMMMKDFTLGQTVVTEDMYLPGSIGEGTTVTWSSSDETYLNGEGIVTRPAVGEGDKPVTLTATVEYKGVKDTKEFTVTVKETAYGKLLTYINDGNTDRTDALHYAVSIDGETWDVLNDGKPVLYPSDGSNKMGSPVAFLKTDGTFGLIATDDNNSQYIFVYDSENLITFTNPRYVALNTDGVKVSDLSVSYDGEKQAYAVYYNDGGSSYVVYTEDFVTFTDPEETEYTKDSVSGTLPEGAQDEAVIELTQAEYEALVAKYGRVSNTSVNDFSDIVVEVGTDMSTVKLPDTLTASYSDGSTKDFGITWDEDSLAEIDTSEPGEYTVTGNAVHPTYDDILVEQRADPYVIKDEKNGCYYFTGSYPVCGNEEDRNGIGYDRIVLRKADTISGLSEAQEVTIWWENQSAKANRYIWAPELHKIGDTWYVLFTASRSGNVWDIRPHMLKCMGDDPMDPVNWQLADESNLYEVKANPGDPLAFTNFSLDMTYFEAGGKNYVAWAEKPNNISKIYLATVDPDQPWQLTSDAVVLSTPDYAWEWSGGTIINEGPAVLKHDGKIFLCFSGAAVDYTYCIGMISATEGDDLLDLSNWTKYPTPLLSSDDFEDQCGPGHNSFTYDENGNPVLVYHARPVKDCSNGMDADGNYGHCDYVLAGQSGLNDPCRHARVKSINFAADGTPILNMTEEEELSSENEKVSVKIIVTADADDYVTLTYNASEGGRIQGQTTQTILKGADAQTVTAVAESGYKFTGWSDGVTTAERTDKDVQSNLTVTAEFQKESTPPVEPDDVDKSKLQNAVDLYADADPDLYTAASWQAWKTAWDYAVEVLNDENATQSAVDQALANLEEAVAGLEKKDSGTPQNPTDDGKDSADQGSGKDKAPQTGDNTNIVGPVVGVVIALLLAAAIVIIRKKRK